MTVNLPGSNNDTSDWTRLLNLDAQAKRWQTVPGRISVGCRRHSSRRNGARPGDRDRPPGGHVGPRSARARRRRARQVPPFVQELADRAFNFARPVLLLNGDSHVFKVDQPLADPSSATGRSMVPRRCRTSRASRFRARPTPPSGCGWSSIPASLKCSAGAMCRIATTP